MTRYGSEWINEQRDAEPDIRMLWNRTPRARRPHECDHCAEEITAGEVYESAGWIDEDGFLKTYKVHRDAYRYPSGCPRLRAKDAAELRPSNPGDEHGG